MPFGIRWNGSPRGPVSGADTAEHTEPTGADNATAAPTSAQAESKGSSPKNNNVAKGIDAPNAESISAQAKNLTTKEREELVAFLTDSRDEARTMARNLEQMVAQHRNRTAVSSPGKKKIMAKSIGNAFPVIGVAAAVIAGSMVLMATGPFGLLLGATVALGAYNVHQAMKLQRHVEFLQQNSNEDNDGAPSGRTTEHGDWPLHPMPAGASVGESPLEPAGVLPPFAAGRNHKVESGVDAAEMPGDDDLEEDEDGMAAQGPASNAHTAAPTSPRNVQSPSAAAASAGQPAVDHPNPASSQQPEVPQQGATTGSHSQAEHST